MLTRGVPTGITVVNHLAEAHNGRLDPAPIEMTAGVEQRVRLLNLTQVVTDATASLRPPAGETPPAWTLVARDAMPLRTPLVGHERVPFTVGTTRDLTLLPTHPGDLTLEIRDAYDNSVAATVPIHVVAAGPKVGLVR